MKILKVPIDEVSLWEKNPRAIKRQDFERLKEQIKRLGVYKPLICTRVDGRYVTLGGNMRLRALKELGYKEVDISVVDAKTERERIEYSLSDNDSVGYYEEDKLYELLQPSFNELDASIFSVDFREPRTLAKEVRAFFGDDVILTHEARWTEKDYAAAVKRIMRERPFPYRTVDDFTLINDFFSLCETDAKMSHAGLKICYELHPEIWRTQAGARKLTTTKVWDVKRDEIIDYIIHQYAFGHGLVSLYELRAQMGLANGYQHPWVFPPAIARFYYRRFSRPDDLILDPSAGWGSRMLGYLSLGRPSLFIAVDPSPASNQGNKRILDFLGISRRAVRFIELPFEDWDASEFYGKIGFIITSPPYFDIEKYDGENQSYRRYPTLELWLGWLRSYIIKCNHLLKIGSYLVLNIGPVGVRRIDISEQVKQYLIDAGFEIEKIEIELVSRGRYSKDYEKHQRGEPFYIAKKIKRVRHA